MNAEFALRQKRPIPALFDAAVVAVAGAKRTCKGCGDKFIGSSRAQYCTAACKQRAHRGRGANRNAPRVTVAIPKSEQGSDFRSAPSVHSAEAVGLRQALDAELAQKSDAMGLPPEQPLEWSAVELANLETIADAIDRTVDLQGRYRAADDDKVRVKLSGEIRLLQRLAADLLRRVHTDLPAAPTYTSVKAQRAANTRWARNAAN